MRVGSGGLAELLAREIGAALKLSVQERGSASLALAGGTTPRAAYEILGREADVPWPQISIFFGDERCVDPDDPDSNYRMAREALLSRLSASPKSVERMRAELVDREAAARAYEAVLPEAIDVLVLGVGEDGHTASLFPNSPALGERDRTVVPVVGPKPPPNRLTFTPKVLNAARLVLVVAAGAGKADAVARALEAPLDIAACPSQLVRDAVWLMDHAAAGGLSGAWS